MKWFPELLRDDDRQHILAVIEIRFSMQRREVRKGKTQREETRILCCDLCGLCVTNRFRLNEQQVREFPSDV
jgi:hypothetical protein